MATSLPIADAFRALLASRPDAQIAWTPSGARTCQQLHAAAQVVERLLADVPAGSRVGLSVRDGFQLMAGFLATLRLGHAAVLLDASDPRAPRRDLAGRLGAAAVIVDQPELRVLSCMGERQPAGSLRAIKLTSGSTAEPRAIGVDEAQLLADASQLEGSMGIGDGDRVLAAVPMTFSYGVGNLLVPALAFGRELVLPDGGHPLGLLRAMRAGEPTVLPAVPALLRALLPGSLQLPASLRLVISAGAVLPPTVAQEFRTRFARPVHTFYGSTESGGICYDRTGTAAERGFVGTPVDGVAVVCAADGRIEVRSRAVGTALDGCGNPANERFLAPDLGAFVAGELRLRGRQGLVFDVGGYKVDPREIEQILEAVPAVRDAVVVPWRDEHDRASCAAVVAARGIDGAALRRHCAQRLPPAKVPRRIAVVDQLPRNARGKLMREDVGRLLAGQNHKASDSESPGSQALGET